MIARTLAEVAAQARAGEPFSFVLRNFLDAFRASPAYAALADEPGLLSGSLPEGATVDAYLAATAESLAEEFRLPEPAWVRSEARRLRRPWFAVPWSGLRAVLLQESPAAFRSRNLFVSANALSRA
jgi:hypothetical protein